MPEDKWKQYYFRDTDFIDRWLYRDPKVRKLWRIVNSAPSQSLPGILTAMEISRWANERLGMVSSGDQEQPVGIITTESAKIFIERVTSRLVEEIEKISL